MRIGFHNFYASLNEKLFTEPNAPIGDELLLPFNVLGERAKARGHECVPIRDTTNFATLDAIVFIDFPGYGPELRAAKNSGAPLYLITFEPPVVRPENWEVHDVFRHVFTWNDDLIRFDPAFYRKLNYAQRFPLTVPHTSRINKAVLVASNKSSSYWGELYSKRLETIMHAPDFLDLYGPGWEGFPSWKGAVMPGHKRIVMSQYRFAIVYENCAINGYITEKIFDAMIAGCIPVYLGAPNVKSYIPENCFVDRRDFKTDAAILRYLTTMSDIEYRTRIRVIEAFFSSRESYQFGVTCFAETILDTVTT